VSPISVSAEKRAAVNELRWMIEEFKLALFAPEIKTAFPISAVRLARKIAEIDAIG
jgi:ATP-dependent helicase HrpA